MIDYMKIARAVEYYKTCDYEYIDAPWFVSLDSLLVTRPSGTRIFSTFAGELVASGEQSFIEMRKKLKPGKYQCVTPCFRDDKYDKLHQMYFMKNELIWVPEMNVRPICSLVDIMINESLQFFKRYGEAKIVEIKYDHNNICSKDIFVNGIEVGSYGVRLHDGFTWCYGTGCAEPRLSMVSKELSKLD